MATIGKKTLNEAADMLKTQLLDYQAEIDTAYCQSDEKKFPVSLKLKFEPAGSGTVVTSEITFVADKVKDSNEKVIDENAKANSKGALFDIYDQKRRRYLEILLRDFRPLTEYLKRKAFERMIKGNPVKFKKFVKAA